MTTEREVSYRLTGRADSSVAKPLKDVTAAAKEASAEVAKTDRAIKGLGSVYGVQGGTHGVQASQRAASAHTSHLVAQADARVAAQKAQKTAALRESIADQEAKGLREQTTAANARKRQEMAGAEAKAKGKGGGIGGALGQMGGMTGLGHAAWPLAILAAGGKGLDIAQHGGPMGEGGFAHGKFSGDKMKESLLWESQKLPIFGTLLKLSNEFEALAEKVRRVTEAEDALARAQTRIPLKRQEEEARTQIGNTQADINARRRFGSSTMGPQFQIGLAAQRATEAAQDRIAGASGLGGGQPNRIPGRGQMPGAGTYGYGRAEQQADVAAKIDFQKKLDQQAVEAQRVRDIEAARKNRADRNVLRRANDEFEAGKRRPGADAYVEETNKLDPRYTDDQLKMKDARTKAAAALDEHLDTQKALQAALEAQNAVSIQQGATLLQQAQARVDLMTSERDRLTGIVQQEKQRLQGAKESFGLNSPLVRKQLLQLSRDVKGGKELSEHELQFAQQHGGALWQNTIQKIGGKRAGAEGDEMVKNLGEEARGKEAEKGRGVLEKAIGEEVEKNKDVMTEHLRNVLQPQLQEMTKTLIQMFADEIKKATLAAKLEKQPLNQ